jgi:peptide-methionine (R)-S-oxide reductase
MKFASIVVPFALVAILTGLAAPARAGSKPETRRSGEVEKIVKTDQEWQKILTPDQYRVLRRKGTEIAFTGRYWNNHAKGIYRCAGCGLELFDSDAKFESGTGWPSFWKPAVQSHVTENQDSSWGMRRVEVVCSRCGGHLGHLFDDGPKPTGLRYCINSAALTFDPAKSSEPAK